MSPGLGQIQKMFLYDGEVTLNGHIAWNTTMRIFGLIRHLVMDEGKKYMPYLEIEVSNVAPYFIGRGELYLNRDFLGLPSVSDIVYFLWDIVIIPFEDDQTEDEMNADMTMKLINAKEAMKHGIDFVLEYAEVGLGYFYCSLIIGENSKIDFSFGLSLLAIQRVDAVIALSQAGPIAKNTKRPKICNGFSARAMGDIQLLGSWFWIDYFQNACKKGKPSPLLLKSGQRPRNYGRQNKTTFTLDEKDECMKLAEKLRKNENIDKDDQPANETENLNGIGNAAGMQKSESNETATSENDESAKGAVMSNSDVLLAQIYTTGILIYPSIATVKGKGLSLHQI